MYVYILQSVPQNGSVETFRSELVNDCTGETIDKYELNEWQVTNIAVLVIATRVARPSSDSK